LLELGCSLFEVIITMLLLRDVFQPYAWLYRDFLGITKRQSEVIIAGPQCYELCSESFI